MQCPFCHAVMQFNSGREDLGPGILPQEPYWFCVNFTFCPESLDCVVNVHGDIIID